MKLLRTHKLRRFKTLLTRSNKTSQLKLFFIDGNDSFDQDEISEDNRRLIMDIIHRSTFIAGAKMFVQDTKVAELETGDSVVKRKM